MKILKRLVLCDGSPKSLAMAGKSSPAVPIGRQGSVGATGAETVSLYLSLSLCSQHANHTEKPQALTLLLVCQCCGSQSHPASCPSAVDSPQPCNREWKKTKGKHKFRVSPDIGREPGGRGPSRANPLRQRETIRGLFLERLGEAQEIPGWA